MLFMVNSPIALGTAVLFPKHNVKLYEVDDFCIGNDRQVREIFKAFCALACLLLILESLLYYFNTITYVFTIYAVIRT